MERPALRIVFMGTPGFAVESLQRIYESRHDVVGVVTAVDRPSGRGRKLRPSAVKEYALANDIPVLQPPKLKAPDFIDELAALEADLFVVVAFRMLPEVVWAMPGSGTFNVHASLLPQYRGAAPINWAIINGEQESGVTTFFIDEKIDTGEIIDSVSVRIQEKETAGSLHDKLMVAGADLCLQTVEAISAATVRPKSQKQFEENDLRPAPKIFNAHRAIDWSASAESIDRLIRGMAPYPAATSTLYMEEQELSVKIYAVELLDTGSLSPGSIRTDGKTRLMVGTADGDLLILEMQLPGKRRMDIRSILNGNPITDEAVLR